VEGGKAPKKSKYLRGWGPKKVMPTGSSIVIEGEKILHRSQCNRSI